MVPLFYLESISSQSICNYSQVMIFILSSAGEIVQPQSSGATPIFLLMLILIFMVQGYIQLVSFGLQDLSHLG